MSNFVRGLFFPFLIAFNVWAFVEGNGSGLSLALAAFFAAYLAGNTKEDMRS